MFIEQKTLQLTSILCGAQQKKSKHAKMIFDISGSEKKKCFVQVQRSLFDGISLFCLFELEIFLMSEFVEFKLIFRLCLGATGFFFKLIVSLNGAVYLRFI